MVLDRINGPNDIKNIDREDYKELANEIRRFLVNKISKTGGHVSSNLGVVELTMALHLCLDFPKDKLIWDVGHQAYTHKVLTGRKDGFETLRQFEGMSGFPKRKESDSDSFDTGHSSTSISVALGFAKARDLSCGDHKVYAVIGDGALSGGMAYEALNNAARLKSNMVIVLNDNNMSISENVGGMATYLGKLRTNVRYQGLKDAVQSSLEQIPHGDAIISKIKKSKDLVKRVMIRSMLFEDMGLTYIGPIDGHNIDQLVTAFQSASQLQEAVIVHVVTKKGKGYKLAQNNPAKFHGIGPFHVKTGEEKNQTPKVTYTQIFSEALIDLARKNEKITAITAAMPSGTGLQAFKKKFPNRFFDVGIAEEHAVTFAAGLAAGGFKPVVAIYSTFLQRSYDQILHDVCISNLPVIFAVDRAGIVGNDGETHQGIFDLSFLTSIPNLTVISPKNDWEMAAMLEYAVEMDGPVAIRYPRGNVYQGLQEFKEPIAYGKSEELYKESGIVLLAVGNMVQTAVEVREQLKRRGYQVSLVNVRFISPLDEELLHDLVLNHNLFVTLEENIESGGFGMHISGFLCKYNYMSVEQINISVPNQYVEHGDTEVLKERLGLDCQSIVDKICDGIIS